MVHWPGDAPFERRKVLGLADGGCNLSEISGSAHTGTHMDAPLHFLDNAAAIDTMPIEATIGRARVIEIKHPHIVSVEELEPYSLESGERILLKTANSRLCWQTPAFQENFVHITPETARYLARKLIRTIGIDYLSVGQGDDNPETHRILLGAGIWIIEGLNLAHPDPGDYELVCLPLKIVGADGAPARAAIRKVDR